MSILNPEHLLGQAAKLIERPVAGPPRQTPSSGVCIAERRATCWSTVRSITKESARSATSRSAGRRSDIGHSCRVPGSVSMSMPLLPPPSHCRNSATSPITTRPVSSGPAMQFSRSTLPALRYVIGERRLKPNGAASLCSCCSRRVNFVGTYSSPLHDLGKSGQPRSSVQSLSASMDDAG